MPGKAHKTKQAKRRDKLQYRAITEQAAAMPEPSMTLDVDIPEDVAQLQIEDPTLRCWFDKVGGWC